MSKVTDPIADLLTRIRNGVRAQHDEVECPSSKLKLEVCRILVQEKFIEGYQYLADDKQGTIKIQLKYGPRREPVIRQIKRVSKPGLRVYAPADRLPRVLNGMGIAILSTNRGVVADREARRMHVGGEVLCHVW